MLYLKFSALEIIAVLGAFLVFKKAKFPDFGILGSYILSAFLTATIIKYNFSPFYSPFIGIISGILVGFLTSLLHYKIKVNALLSGICSLFFVFSICYLLFDTGSYNHGENIISSNEQLILIFFITYIFVCMAIYWIELTNWGTELRASALSSNSLSYLNINKNKQTIFYLLLGNSLIGLNSSMKFLAETNIALNMTSGVLEELMIEMVLGLFVLDIFMHIIQNKFNRLSTFFLYPVRIRILDYIIPLVGTLIFQFIYTISFSLFDQGYHLRALIVFVLVILILVARKFNIDRYSSLEFIGVNA